MYRRILVAQFSAVKVTVSPDDSDDAYQMIPFAYRQRVNNYGP